MCCVSEGMCCVSKGTYRCGVYVCDMLFMQILVLDGIEKGTKND